MLQSLRIGKRPGETLTEAEVDAVLDFYMNLLQGALIGATDLFRDPVVALHQQVPFDLPEGLSSPIVTLSGGVGELVYEYRQGKPWPATTQFGDFGIDLARRLASSPFWAARMGRYVPEGLGRATVYGLLRHSTQVSGSTLFLPRPETLPLRDLPIFGTIREVSTETAIGDLLDLVQRSARGGCLQVTLANPDVAAVRMVGERIAEALRARSFAAEHPLVLLVRANVGKVLGHYVTAWGGVPVNLVVIDEIAIRDAQYAHVGRLHNQVVPVSFYGLRPRED
jgi:ethanolamine utilization protein EutA